MASSMSGPVKPTKPGLGKETELGCDCKQLNYPETESSPPGRPWWAKKPLGLSMSPFVVCNDRFPLSSGELPPWQVTECTICGVENCDDTPTAIKAFINGQWEALYRDKVIYIWRWSGGEENFSRT